MAIQKQWQLAEAAPEEFFSLCPELSRGLVQLLYNKGFRSHEEIEEFLYPEKVALADDPFLFRDMAVAVAVIIKHIKQGSKIVVCGDYDADGVTSSALLEQVLKTLKAKVEVWIPSRFGEGYGLNKEIVKELVENNFSLIITVDNGIKAREEIIYAQSLGLEVVVTDHHEGPKTNEEMPPCPVIDPILEQETYPYKYLCGVGVAFKLSQALIKKSTLSEEDKTRLEEAVLDLVAIGTIADCVSLTGENRRLVKKGLELLNKKTRLGLRELINISQLSLGEITEWNISWQITPRLNAAGRIDHATAAYRLLATQDTEEAKKIALELNQRNTERQALTESIVKAAAAQFGEKTYGEKILVAIADDVLSEGESWSEGVVGLAAGRLAERFNRPCLVICQSEGNIKGSGRSIEQFDIVNSLEFGKQYLSRYGGHKMACGFTIKDKESVKPFVEAVKKHAEEVLSGINLAPKLKLEAELSALDLKPNIIKELDLLRPYGQDNIEPKFLLSNMIVEDILVMGKEKNHLKFMVAGLWAVAFNRATDWQDIKIGDTIDLAANCELNVFNGRSSLQLRVIDLKRGKED